VPEPTGLSEAKRRLLDAYRRGGQTDAAADTGPTAVSGGRAAGPLSPAQHRLWLHEQLEPGSAAYNLPCRMRLRGRLDPDALARGLNETVRRHEILRTVVIAAEGQEPRGVVLPATAPPLPSVDLRDLQGARQEDAVRRLADAQARQPFDLGRGPLLRATLARLDDEERVLLLTVHHIIFDGWSIDIFMRELSILYESFASGRSSPLPDLALQYADIAAWQRAPWQEARREAQLSYWRRQLDGMPPGPTLPLDRPRPATPSRQGARYAWTLPAPLSRAARDLSRQEGVTLFTVLLAALQVVLHRYSGEDDIAVGIAAAGRTHTSMEGLIGFFVNTLALRGDLSGNPSVRELLGRAQRVALDAYEHQDAPFERVVQEVRPDRAHGGAPLFNVLFNYSTPDRRLELPGLTIDAAWRLEGTARVDLTLYAAPSEDGEGIRCVLYYDAALFDEATVARLADHLQTLLEGLVADPSQPISTLPLLPEAERRQLLEGWNDTARQYPRHATVHRLFEEQAARTPEAVAAVHADGRLTYGALNRRANQLAYHLRTLGVGPETLVGICVDHSLEMLVGLLGILKAGGAYVPLDPTFPSDRIAFMLDDARAPVLVASRRTAAALPPHGARLVLLDADWPEIARREETNPADGAGPANLAYVIYTSGSTGWPKGVQVPHRALVNLLCSMAREPGLSAEDRLLAVTTLSFDIAGLEIFLPLTVGARVVIVSRDVATSGPALIEALTVSGATVMQATPATWQLLLAAGWRGDGGLTALCGGEALPRELAARLLPRVGSLWNMYGPTETTIWSAVHKIEREDAISIGHPIANTRLYVLDTYDRLAPIGVPGELHIGGDGLARGYLNRPELTDERFIPHPLSDKEGARLYRTGDLARYRADGALEFLGRLDTQVKVRGYRIELGEIEAALGQQPGVQAAVVVAREDRPGDRQLVAYVVASPEGQGAPAPSDALALALRRRLPAYMVPAAFVLLDTLPLTPNGKTDRRRLPPPERMEGKRGGSATAAPGAPTERALAAIWSEVLGVPLERIGIHDDFFRLGGHSLLATRAIARAHAALDTDIPVRALFDHPTIATLARAIDDHRPRGQSGGAPAQPATITPPAIRPVARVAYRVSAAPKR